MLVHLCGCGGLGGTGHNFSMVLMKQDPPEGKPSPRLECGNQERCTTQTNHEKPDLKSCIGKFLSFLRADDQEAAGKMNDFNILNLL